MMRLFLLLGFCLALSSCGHAPFKGKEVVGADEFVMDSYLIKEGKGGILELTGHKVEQLSAQQMQDFPETIGEGDILTISLVSSAKELNEALRTLSNSSEIVVRDQKIQLPGIDEVQVGNLSLSQAQAAIQNAYERLHRDAQVFLSIKEKKESLIYLSGLVSTPTLVADGKLRLFEALSLAKIPTEANLFRSYVAREGKMLPVDLNRLMREADMSQNIVLKGGDKIYIADALSSSVMVMGEVTKPVVLPVYEGSMNIKFALAQAGGIPFTGDKSYIQVIRGSLQNPKIYTLNWKHIMRLPSDSLLLIPGDVVYVATTPLGEWNNFVNQILPTLIGADLIANGGRHLGIDVR